MIKDKEILQELFDVLKSNNIDIERDCQFVDGEVKYIDSPSIRMGWYNGVDGYYFNKSDYGYFDIDYVKSLFPFQIQNKTIELVDVSDAEVDDDRIWKSSIHFVIN